MVMNRLIAPASEHAMPAWMRRTALGELLGTDFATLSEAALYRNTDRLHPKRTLIESDLVERERELFKPRPDHLLLRTGNRLIHSRAFPLPLPRQFISGVKGEGLSASS